MTALVSWLVRVCICVCTCTTQHVIVCLVHVSHVTPMTTILSIYLSIDNRLLDLLPHPSLPFIHPPHPSHPSTHPNSYAGMGGQAGEAGGDEGPPEHLSLSDISIGIKAGRLLQVGGVG